MARKYRPDLYQAPKWEDDIDEDRVVTDAMLRRMDAQVGAGDSVKITGYRSLGAGCYQAKRHRTEGG